MTQLAFSRVYGLEGFAAYLRRAFCFTFPHSCSTCWRVVYTMVSRDLWHAAEGGDRQAIHSPLWFAGQGTVVLDFIIGSLIGYRL